MAVRHPEARSVERTAAEPPRVGDTVVLRPTKRQRVGSALLKSLCAAPLLLALPVMSGNQRQILLWVAGIAAVVTVAIVLLAERDLWVKLSPTGLTTRAGSIPWWAIDDIRVQQAARSSCVMIRSWQTAEMTLPAPRNGWTDANPHFDAEERLIEANWRRYSRVVPTEPPGMQAVLKRAEAASAMRDLDGFDDVAPADVHEGVDTVDDAATIDLRDEGGDQGERHSRVMEPPTSHPADRRVTNR
jgi:hypothetical protein